MSGKNALLDYMKSKGGTRIPPATIKRMEREWREETEAREAREKRAREWRYRDIGAIVATCFCGSDIVYKSIYRHPKRDFRNVRLGPPPRHEDWTPGVEQAECTCVDCGLLYNTELLKFREQVDTLRNLPVPEEPKKKRGK